MFQGGRNGLGGKAFVGGLAALAFLCFWSACRPSEAVPDEVRLGILIQQASSFDGPPAVRAARMAVEEVNAAGGLEVGGRRLPVSLLAEDPSDHPEDVVRSALRLINQDGVVALIGPILSRNALLVSRAANDARVPMVSPGATHPEVTEGKPFSFRVNFTDPFQGRELAHFAHHELAAADAAVLYDLGNHYSRSLAEVFRSSFTNAGGKVTFFEGVLSEDDLTGPLTRIRELRPAVLFLPNFSRQVIVQVQQARRLGVEAALLGGDSWSPSLFAPRPEFEGAYMAAPWHPSTATEDPRARAFVDAYREAWGEDPVYAATAQSYDAVGVVLEAIRRAGRLRPEAVQAELAQIVDYPGVTGDITFRGTGGDPPRQGVLLQLRGGEVCFVKRLSAEN